jgi:hypothetical protein
MSVTVSTAHGTSEPTARAVRWATTDHGTLQLLDGGAGVVAEYAPGSWVSVASDDVPTDGQRDPLADVRAMLFGSWSAERIRAGLITVDVLRELRQVIA